MNFKSVVASRRGGPDVLQIIENDLREPAAGEARIRVLAAGVSRTDINYRYGLSPLSPRAPFVPGYQIVGTVDALGAGVAKVKVGERVAALMGHGGYTEVIYLGSEHLAPVPASIDPAEAVVLVLNYVSAQQMLHRVAKVKTGDKVLVIGASGGVGTALLELGGLAGLKMYGTASASKHAAITGFGAIPIDYHSADFVEVIRRAEPGGLDFVFDGMGANYGDRAAKVLKRGGKLVAYAAPTGFGSMLAGLLKLGVARLHFSATSAEFYGLTVMYLQDKKPFMDDLQMLFKLLEERRIRPLISEKFPVLEARKANELLESGQVTGNIVLLAPELL